MKHVEAKWETILKDRTWYRIPRGLPGDIEEMGVSESDIPFIHGASVLHFSCIGPHVDHLSLGNIQVLIPKWIKKGVSIDLCTQGIRHTLKVDQPVMFRITKVHCVVPTEVPFELNDEDWSFNASVDVWYNHLKGSGIKRSQVFKSVCKSTGWLFTDTSDAYKWAKENPNIIKIGGET